MPVFRDHDSVREKLSSFFSQAITFGFIRISFCRISGTVPLFPVYYRRRSATDWCDRL